MPCSTTCNRVPRAGDGLGTAPAPVGGQEADQLQAAAPFVVGLRVDRAGWDGGAVVDVDDHRVWRSYGTKIGKYAVLNYLQPRS